MFRFIKGLAKTAFWGVVLFAGITMGARALNSSGHGRNVIQNIKASVQSQLEDAADNPAALRDQLQRLEAEYPKRIQAVQQDLGELIGEAKRLRWEQAVSERVVEMAQVDLNQETGLATGEAAGKALVRAAGFPSANQPSRAMSPTAKRLVSLLDTHNQKAEDASRDLGYIEAEITRFQALLEELETERADYHSQLQQLNRQVDSIRRNERLLSMLRERQGVLAEASRFESHSLNQITGRLEGIRSQQEAELDLLSGTEMEVDYEGRAKAELKCQDQATQIHAISSISR